MDTNELLSTMLSSDSVRSISKATGTRQKDVKNVLNAALPSLLVGALGQAQNEETVEGFAGALADHAKDDTRDMSSFVSNVDMLDGGKILTHLLGGSATAAAQDAATRSGLDLGKTIKILAVAAPLLMTLLGQHNQQAQPQQQAAASNVSPVINLLGGLLGGGQPQQQAGLGGNLLGSLLGGSQPQQQQTGLGGNLLGSLLGGSQPQQQQTGLGGNLLGSLLGGSQPQQQQTGLGGDLLSSLLGGSQPQQQQQAGLGGDLLGSLLGVNQQAQPTQSTTNGKKKKKKPAASANAELLSLDGTPAQNQNQQTPGLMDILMGLLK